MLEGKTSDGIMFKKVEKKTLNVQADRINDGLSILKTKTLQKRTI